MKASTQIPIDGSAHLDGVGFTVSAHYSPNDAAPVIEIDTTGGIGEIRVYVNGNQVFAGDPEEVT